MTKDAPAVPGIERPFSRRAEPGQTAECRSVGHRLGSAPAV